MKTIGGILWLDISDLCEQLHLEGMQKSGSAWFHSRFPRWQEIAESLGIGNLACRRPQPLGMNGAAPSAQDSTR
eukprot:9040732-Pyramimonas_sp.AAC.1